MCQYAPPSYFIRSIAVGVLVTLFSTFLPMNLVAEALVNVKSFDAESTVNPGGGLEEIRKVGNVETRYGLVAILVEEDVWEASAGGLTGAFSFLGNTKLQNRIETYAEDIQSTLPWTKSVILTVSEDDTTVDIQQTLEEFYYEGNPEDSDPTKLTGLVIIGDVPLPVVNKNGHRFISMLPYTDFEDPSYLLDENTLDFVPNGETTNQQADIWHGLIVPPLDGDAGLDLLAVFFDKNHSFHEGDEEYTEFEERVFLADFVTEESAINSVSFDSYKRFLNLWEELTYYRYSNDLAERVYTEILDGIEPGDSLDNDFDGLYDEEAENGIDDDGDGLVDEDLGDGFFGIDNDGDCSALDEEDQDSNGDGIPCNGGEYDEDGNELRAPDTNVDEDGFEDNNNDKEWHMYWPDAEGSEMFEDRETDEDPPGDVTGGEDEDGDGVVDGDGCAGICGVDDNGDSVDHDGDGYPTGWEILYGYDPYDEKKPHKRVSKMVDKYYDTDFTSDDDDEGATAYLAALFTDQMHGIEHASCLDDDGVFHPEWDDDEDGFCDEDGSDEVILWADENGTPYTGTCTFNDADCDGEIDEDPIGIQPDSPFDDLPDIQAEGLINDNLISRYAQIFDQPQGVWNRLVAQTGRYVTRSTDGDGNLQNDYDTAIALITKKDETVLNYLRSVNDLFEEEIDEIVEDDLQEDIPLIGVMRIIGEYRTYTEDDEGEIEIDDWEDVCTKGLPPDIDGEACLQFVNHSTDALLQAYDTFVTDLQTKKLFINGQHLFLIEDVGQCTLFAGTDAEDAEDGQMVEFNALYSSDAKELSKSEIRDRKNCVPENMSMKEDIPQLCNTVLAIEDIRALDGARELEEEDPDIRSRWEIGAEACFEFREMETFSDYAASEGDYNDWLTKKLRKFRKDDDSEEQETYEEFLEFVEDERVNGGYDPIPGEATLRKKFTELDILSKDEDRSYTVMDLFEEMGYGDFSDDDIDTFIALRDDDSALTINYPEEGSGTEDVYQIKVYFDKKYILKDSVNNRGTAADFTDDLADAMKIPSMYKHVMPTNEVLNEQIENQGTENLPIDLPRRVSFLDSSDDPQELVYINVFEAEELSDVEDQIADLSEAVGEVAGGSAFENDVADFMELVNEDALEDALLWYRMNIDEKHKYIFTHYLGAEEPIFNKTRGGYEMVEIIADGNASEMFYAFNGSRPFDDEDAELNYGSIEAFEEALADTEGEEPEYESISEVSNTTPVILSEWIAEIQAWLQDLGDTVSNLDTYEGENACGDVQEFGGNEDASGNGIPDAADNTVSISLTSDDNSVLQAGGEDVYIVSASARMSDGSINTGDSYTEVELEIVSGDDVITVPDTLMTLTNGLAHFYIYSAEAGSFRVRASAANRNGVSRSDSLSGTVTAKYVVATTFISDIETTAETEEGTTIEFYNDDGDTVATFDPETGELELESAEAELREATSELPTRIAVMEEGGETYGVIFIIAEEGVTVEEVGDLASVESTDDETELYVNDELVGLVTDLGLIGVADGYSLEFDDPNAINVYDPIHIVDEDGEDIFEVILEEEYTEAELLDEIDPYTDYLSFERFWPLGERGVLVEVEDDDDENRIARAAAASVIEDSDGDKLDDLEEWIIGTDMNEADTDGDGYEDGSEVFSGFDPLSSTGDALFTDIGSDHEAYHDVAVLYLRGVIKGYADGSFRPDYPMSREEFVKVDLGAVCIVCDSFDTNYQTELLRDYYEDPFPDTDINDDLLACVAEARVDGIVSGYAGGADEGYFLPTQHISRAEATKVLVETAGLEVDELEDEDLVWYTEYVRTAQKNGLFPEGRFDEVDDYEEDQFYSWFVADQEGSREFASWLESSISRSEFAMMAVNLLAEQDCRDVDTDGDGLSDTEEELIYGTDPELADTDGGGVNDLDEILRDSDPLDADDDVLTDEEIDAEEEAEEEEVDEEDFSGLGDYDHDPGLYVVSDQADFETVAVAIGEGSATINLFTNEIPADGESVLYVRAEIRDQDGEIYVDDDTSVIDFVLSSSAHGALTSERVQVQNGQAETALVTSTTAGELTIEALISDGSLPSQDAVVNVYPGDPVRLALTARSSVLPAGGEADNDMRVSLYDTFGNIANNGFYTVTFETEGGIELLDLSDEDPESDGVQVTTPDGYIDFRILSSVDAETATVKVSLLDVEGSGDTYEIEHLDGMEIDVATTKSFMFAGGSTSQDIEITVVDSIGATVTGFNGDIYLSLSDPAYGSFDEETLELSAGTATAELSPGTLAGVGSIIADSRGIEGGSASVTIKPADAYELRIRKDDDTFVVPAGERARFNIEAYDEYGNLVTTDSSTEGTIRITDVTEDYGTLSSDEFSLNQGEASFSVNVVDGSGTLNLVAASDELVAGTWKGEIKFSISGDEFADVEPQMLYGSLLGGPFGDVTQEDYIAGWMTFNGRTQAMTSLISEPVPKKRIATIDAEGSISLPDQGLISMTIAGAGNTLPMRIQWREFPADNLIGEIFLVIPSRSKAVSTELLTTRADMELEENDDGSVTLREDSTAAIKIRDDGQVVIMDPNYSLAVNGSAEGLGLVVLRTTEQVMRIDYAGAWDDDVEVLDPSFDLEDWDSKSSGIYLRPTSETVNNVVNIPTGNSTGNPMGVAIVDPDEELPNEMKPSMGYISIDAAEEDGNVGWEGENKNFLLFAAGNSVGQSNLYYGSEVGVVLGDPTISLPTEGEPNDIGFTDDVGTLLSASPDTILTMMDIDYNDDGQMDVLIAYEDGRIEVLQNYKAPVRLQSRGTLLFIEGGINSVDQGDFNGDGVEDLLIATKEACYAEEMCLYVYENIGGGFVAENLELSGIATPTQVEVVDLNNDDYDDLVLVDENMVLYTVWNAEGTLETIDEIRDFGLEVEESQNLYADVVIRYDDLEDGSVGISLPSTETSSSSEVTDVDLDDFVDALGLESDIDLQFNSAEDSGSTTVTRLESFDFEYADDKDMVELFETTKQLEDADGGKIEVGDILTYTLEVENNSGSDLEELYISDSLSNSYSFDEDTFECSNCSEGNAEVELMDGSNTRPWVFGPLELADGDSIEITYDVSVVALPKLSVMVGQDIYTDYKDDKFADIAVSLEGNSTGQLMLYYSDGYITEAEGGTFGFGGTSYRRVSYQEKEYSPEEYEEEYDTTEENPFGDEDENGIPDFIENMDAELGFPVVENGFDVAAEVLGAVDSDGDGYYSADEMFDSDEDVDNDGLLDTIDFFISSSDILIDPSFDLNGDDVVLSAEPTLELEAEIDLVSEGVEDLTQQVEEIVSMFTCNGGCLALPPSIAFLASGKFHDPFTGTALAKDPGFPVFGILPYLPVVCTLLACEGSNVLRIYLAPTTTLGLGLGICLGPKAVGQCFALNIPLLQFLGVCDAINGFISDSLSSATAYVSEGANQAFQNTDLVNVSASTDEVGVSSGLFNDYVVPSAENVNIQIPGFPSIFTEWWKAQKLEFFKMLDLPDITFIYPDPKSLTTEFTGIGQQARDNIEGDVVQLDQDTKVEQMLNKASILGMEKWLNMVHALPLIAIEPDPVYIHYPAITPEEIELVKRDWEDWIDDTKTEWDRFIAQFCLGEEATDEDEDKTCFRENLSDEEEEVLGALEEIVSESIAAMEANLAILESYAQIPFEIIKLREIQAYYAKAIICYLDAILGFTAGYLSENAQRVEAWIQWVIDLRDIIDGWQLILDAAIDFMESCDKCTNQRWSGLQFIFSLFTFIPEFPVIEMPKLPDIVLDVSNIQVGLEVIWPDIQFVPERIDIPKIPRIVLPTAYFNLDVDLDVDLDVSIPTLPEFPIIFELPELPGLPLPDLPSLPPPPAVPEIDPAIKASINIVSNVLKIICIIRSGFIPTPEGQLKSKIEEITQRPAITLPFDLEVEVEWPELSFDFLKKIEVNTYLNLTADFTTLYDFIDSIGEESAEISGDIADELNEAMQDLADEIQEALLSAGEIEVGLDVEAEGEVSAEGASGEIEAEAEVETHESEEDIEAYNHPAVETALAYSDHPLVKSNINALKEMMETLQEEFDAWDDAMPEDYTLVASQRILEADDPLLNRYDEIISEGTDLDVDFLASIEGTPLAGVAVMRDSLIAYVDDLEKGTRQLEGMDGESFQKYIAQEYSAPRFLLASDGTTEGYSTEELWQPEELVGEPLEIDVELASEGHASDALDGLEFGASPESVDTGLFIYNAELGVAEKLIAYSQESDEDTSILFIDVDDDGDDDVVYSLGGDIYFKENYTEDPRLRYATSDPEQSSIEEMRPDHGAVHNVKRGNNDFEEVSFSFSQSAEAVGYEVLLYDSLDAQEAEPEENIKRLLLLEDTKNDTIPFYNEEGEEYRKGGTLAAEDNSATYQAADDMSIVLEKNSDFVVPEIRESRLVVVSESGKVQLYNSPKRTVISANGELETADSVVFQTLEKTIIEVTIEDKTTQIELPAQTWIDFGRKEERVIRVESGEVLWVQPDEIEEEQDLIEGMEIFAEELITLESVLADVSLATTEGVVIELDNQESFVMDLLRNPSDPSARIALENGAYYSMMRGIYDDGTVGTLSDNILLNPQVCADDSAPYPILDDSEIELAIFSTAEIGAESSFDSDSEIVDAFWDFDSSEDVDGDGMEDNDEEYIGLTAEIGPYDDPDEKEATLWITDTAGNIATANVAVSIYVPEISITTASTTEILGTTDPASPEFPFHLVRERQGAVTEIGDGYLTDENGDFTIDDLDLSENLIVFDEEGGEIAEFNPTTKQLLVYDEDYGSMALPSADDWPSRLVVYEEATGTILVSFVFVTDIDRFVTEMPKELEEYDLSNFKSVTVYVTGDEERYDVSETGVLVRDEFNSLEVTISQSGNVTIFDEDYELVKRDADSLDEYLILELYREGELELEMWPGTPDETNITDAFELDLPASDTLFETIDVDYRLSFEDISSSDPLYDDIAELVERGIIEGVESGGLDYFLPDDPINRAEFTKIILGILCIVPSDEAYELPEVFNDILSTDAWYYPYTKEAYLNDLITGYLGEIDEDGLAPYKPGNTINVAEATKIVLEALDKEGIIELPDDLSGEPWYDPYLEIALDLSPYLVGEATAGAETYILTEEEAADPSHELTRYEFVEMSVRVLQAYNCFDLDTDGDGLINFDEESIYGTDPYDADTDDGGIDDGVEVGRGTDPLDGDDDFEETGELDVDPGMYAVTEECLACPCQASVDYASDLIVGDKVFVIIQNEEGEIFGVSNTVTIEE